MRDMGQRTSQKFERELNASSDHLDASNPGPGLPFRSYPKNALTPCTCGLIQGHH